MKRAFAALPLFVAACEMEQTTEGTTYGLDTTPGQDCVINLNPQTQGGPTFVASYEFDGEESTNESGDTIYKVHLTSNDATFDVGGATAQKDVKYVLEVWDVDTASPQGELIEEDDTSNVQSVTVSDAGEPDFDEFAVVQRPDGDPATSIVYMYVFANGHAVRIDVE